MPAALPEDVGHVAKRKRGSPERTAQVSIVAFLKRALPPGSIVAAVKNEHRASSASKGGRMRFYQKRRQEGVTPGFPDLIALLPNARVVLFEVKSPTGDLSPSQRDLHPEISALGFLPVIVCRSIDDAEAGLRAVGIPLRTHAF